MGKVKRKSKVATERRNNNCNDSSRRGQRSIISGDIRDTDSPLLPPITQEEEPELVHYEKEEDMDIELFRKEVLKRLEAIPPSDIVTMIGELRTLAASSTSGSNRLYLWSRLAPLTSSALMYCARE